LRKLFAVTAIICILGPLPAAGDPTPMPLTMIGVGPRGYDVLIGRWKCADSETLPSGLVARPFSVDVFYRTEPDGSISWVEGGSGVLLGPKRTTNENGPISSAPITESIKRTRTGGLRYAAERQEWSISYAVPSGATGEESTRDTGEKAVWTGSAVSAEGSPTDIRDTITFSSPSSYVE